MRHFTLDELVEQRVESGKSYLEFLRVPVMSMGVYHLKAGENDPQSPHAEDEVYYVVSGRASLETNGTKQPIEPGSILFVPAQEPHRFCDIVEDVTVLVLFAPAES